ncbi:MAG TPA: hypothetical protein DD729_09120 [Rhodobacteraceae bacterium]|nr:hypothetical protein [Paracoccaceae bacterium]
MADTLLGGIVINEVLADPNGANNFDTDASGTANHTDEFVEIYNSSAAAIDISGLQLWDAGAGNWFTFPPGTILQPGAQAMVITGVQAGGSLPTSGNPDDLFFDAGRAAPLINNGGDNVVLYDPANDEYVQATFNGDALDDPPNDYSGFSATATQVGSGEDFGNDIDGFSIQRDGNDNFINDQTPTPGTTNVCFTQNTKLATPTGAVQIERLRAGDLLLTKDHGPQAIKWIWAKRQTAPAIQANPALRAVHISAGALGNGMPTRDIKLSRHHRILVSSKIAKRMYDQTEVLVAAKDLLDIAGITLAPAPKTGAIVYYHLLMENHEILFANGAPAESLYLGNETIKAIEPAAKAELELIFGAKWHDFISCRQTPARQIARGKKAHKLAQRHQKNRKYLLQEIVLN